MKWGHGCEVGIYAQHVYTSLTETDTVLGYLERSAMIGTKQQQILDLAGAMLFRGKAVEKKVKVLSGGERARLCMAGLLLGPFNVLVLDEPGNHLDVETVDALAQALLAYEGTVIFTSHDRSFMQTVATNVIEVKDGRVVNYIGDYGAYLAAVTKEIDDAEAADGGRPAARKPPPADRGGKMVATAPAKGESPRNERDLRRELSNLERSIAKLDAEKKQANAALLAATDPAEAVRLHGEMTALAGKLSEAEERWLAIQEQLG